MLRETHIYSVTYIRNLRWKQNYFYTLPPLLVHIDASRISMRVWRLFSQLEININQGPRRMFSLFFNKIMTT
jgi:hypothetical protein